MKLLLFALIATMADPGAWSRCMDLWPEAELAADEAGVEPRVIMAVLMVETGCRAMEGQRSDVTGVGQVSWPSFRRLLEAHGYRGDDLLDPIMGTRAVGTVLGYLLNEYGFIEWKALCLYNIGPRAANLEKPCRYASTVQWIANHVQKNMDIIASSAL